MPHADPDAFAYPADRAIRTLQCQNPPRSADSNRGQGAARGAVTGAWPPGAKRRHRVPHGATLVVKFLNHFERRRGFNSPLSHFFLLYFPQVKDRSIRSGGQTGAWEARVRIVLIQQSHSFSCFACAVRQAECYVNARARKQQ